MATALTNQNGNKLLVFVLLSFFAKSMSFVLQPNNLPLVVEGTRPYQRNYNKNKDSRMNTLLKAACQESPNDKNSKNEHIHKDSSLSKRRRLLLRTAGAAAAAASAALVLSSCEQKALAAPPMAVIAEELGYFPVTNRKGETVMVPKRVSRASSQQAIDLAQHLKKSGAVMYGAYWCPHCARQKELFGSEAWNYVEYIECSSKGYGANTKLCIAKKVDGFPTWIFADKTEVSGEAPLSVLAKASKYPGEFNEELEQNVPVPLGSKACK